MTGAKSLTLKSGSRTSPIELQKVQRLWINRVALIQELNVDHVLPHLIDCGTLSSSELAAIQAASTPHKKTCLLVDILPRKGRRVDWYRHFYRALCNPDTFDNKVRKRYSALADFLDAAIIPHVECVDSTMRLPYFKPLTGIVSNTGESWKSVDVDSLHTYEVVPFASLIDEPTSLFDELQASRSQGDHVLLQLENLALKRMRRLEMLFAYKKRNDERHNPQQLSNAVADVLTDSKIYHLYFKYLLPLRCNFDIDIMGEVAQSFVSQLAATSTHPDLESSVQTGLLLFQFMYGMGDNGPCKSILTTLESILMRHFSKGAASLLWKTRLNLMCVYNMTREFDKAVQTYNRIAESQVLTGREKMNESRLFGQLIILTRETGDMESALIWCKEAIRAAMKSTDPREIVHTFCTVSLTYALTWHANEAALFATEAVKYAKHNLDEYDPLYVEALLQYCHYSNLMKQNSFGVSIAKMALKTAKKIYGGVQIEVIAQLQRSVACALLVGQRTTEASVEALHMAEIAANTARQVLPAEHPTLMSFKVMLARCLQWKAMTGSQDVTNENLAMAEQYVRTARSAMTATTKRAQTLNLLAQIHVKMDRHEEAESEMRESCEMHAHESPHRYLAMTTLAAYLRTVGRPAEAIDLLKEVTQSAGRDCYLKWVHGAYDMLLALLKATNKMSSRANMRYQTQLGDWLTKHPPPEADTWSRLKSAPMSLADVWEKLDDGGEAMLAPSKLETQDGVVSWEQ